MRNGWQSKPFSDCIEKVTYTRKLPRRDFLPAGKYPIVSQEAEVINGHWDSEADIFKVTTPVVVFGDHTKVLKFIDFDFVLGADGVKILQPKRFLLPKFFFYQLQAASLASLGYARHYRLLKDLRIFYPTLSEQRRIVHTIDEALEGMTAVTARVEKNLLSTRELFKSRRSLVFAERNAGWVENSLGELCTFENGDRGVNYPSRSARVTAGVPFINAGHLTDDGLDLAAMDYISRERFDLLTNGKVHPGDILFCLRGSLGKCASVGGLSEGAIASSLVIIRPNNVVLNEFVLAYLRSDLCARMIERFKNGAAQPNLSARSLTQFIMPFPPLTQQGEIVGRLEGMRLETKRLGGIYQRKLAALGELKKTLLHNAFSGELTEIVV